MKIISLESYRQKLYDMQVLSIGDIIEWYDPVFDEGHVGVIQKIERVGKSLKNIDFNKSNKKRCSIHLTNGQSISAILFKKKVS